jgi:peptidoglycan/LPS O-acetylase OafA/YrhL
MSRARLPHRRGIEGLRALAVAAVLLYHAGVGWLPGGFLGVDVFFAVSGYLITSLLLAELDATGRISLRSFWSRRARRLLPAVGALLLVVTIVALIGAHDALGRLRGDVVAAMAYVSNWWQIIRGETYFESFGRPPLLRHLWSLAVEEQLYIVLPLVVAFAGRRRRLLAAGALLGAVASSVLLRVLWHDTDPSRAWFGTDTRSAPLLVGVGLALLLPMAKRRRLAGGARRALEMVAVAALAGLALIMLTVGDRDAALPRWGFPLTAALSGVAVVALTSPSSRIGRVLGIRPLHWLGTRSYAVYLWHWPVIVLTRPHVDVEVAGWRLLTARLLITAVLAEVSWRIVEQPVRTGSFVRSWFELRQALRVRIAIAATAVVAVLAVALGVGMSSAATTATPELLATASVGTTTATTLARIPPTTTTSSPATTVTSIAPPAPAPPAPAPQGAVLAVGDSVMLAARDALIAASDNRIFVDAAIGRQVGDGLDVLQHYKDSGTFANVSAIVVHLGTNGAMSDELFNRLVSIVEGVPRVVVLNVRVPKSWETQSNAAIDGGVPQHPAMRLADWHTASNEPGALADDGVHPSPSGARIYRAIILDGLRDTPPAPTTTQPPPPTTTTTAPPPPSSSTTTSTTSTTAPPPPVTIP